jgi:hypothetical protein
MFSINRRLLKRSFSICNQFRFVSQSTKPILHEYVSPGVLQITLNRADKLNALSVEVGEAFSALVNEIKDGIILLLL